MRPLEMLVHVFQLIRHEASLDIMDRDSSRLKVDQSNKPCNCYSSQEKECLFWVDRKECKTLDTYESYARLKYVFEKKKTHPKGLQEKSRHRCNTSSCLTKEGCSLRISFETSHASFISSVESCVSGLTVRIEDVVICIRRFTIKRRTNRQTEQKK